MKTTELLTKSDKELQQFIDSARREIADTVVTFRTTRATNVKQIHNLKRNLARALTVSRQRQIAAELADERNQPGQTTAAAPAKPAGALRRNTAKPNQSSEAKS